MCEEKDYSEIEKLLEGVESETREFFITTGLSGGCKHVMYVLYSFPNPKNMTKYNNSGCYLGSLSNDYATAIVEARKRLGNLRIQLDAPEDLLQRRIPTTLPFGKYRGETIEEVYDKDPKYIFWLSNQDRLKLKSKVLMEKILEYGKMGKLLVVNENIEKSMPFLPIEETAIVRSLEIYGTSETEGYGTVSKLKDSEGNKYMYQGKDIGNKGDVVELKLKIKKHVTLLGVNFNKLGFR